MSLARAQNEFLAAVLAPVEPDDPGLAVYHRTSLAARSGALAATYPVVRRLVGAAFFHEAAARFAASAPSHCGDLHLYGAGFGAFLARYEPARGLDCLAEVAQLEWAAHESHHAADGAPFDFAALGRLPPQALGRVRIGLHPAVRLIESRHPVLAIWEANQEGRDGTPDRIEGADRVVVRRQGHAVAPVRVGEDEWNLARALDGARTLDELAASALGGELHRTLGRLAELGVLGAFDVAPGA